jgi:DNA repair exonuclease SbcCD ATPase subunit
MTNLDLIRAAIKQDEDQITKLSSDIASSERALQTLEADVARLQERVGGVEAAEFDLTSMRVDMNALGARKNELTEDMSYNTLMLEMLKDTGLKSKVVQQHLPVINAKINQYLGVLDFFVSFNLDESFNETIKSRFRDEFSYSSFSEGEKAKIDLALLFTWRHIGRRLNSVHTNLIVLDEVADSSLDAEGIEHLMAIIETLEEDANVFVISHRAVNESRFSNKIVFEKKGNFSRMIQD